MADNNDTLDAAHQQALDEQIAVNREQRLNDLELIELGPIRDLAPDAAWSGAISATGEHALESKDREIFNGILLESVVATEQGGQVACMDGRALEEMYLAPGPKTAGGTYGNAFRIWLAAIAGGQKMTYEESLDIASQIDTRYGFKPGGHDLSQCGACKNGIQAITAIAEDPREVAAATAEFTATVGREYSTEIQDKLTMAAQKLAPSLPQLVPSAVEAPKLIEIRNADSCPTLARDHREIRLAVFLREGVTLDNNLLIAQTQRQFGKEIHAFGYNWDYHLKIAKELGSDIGAYYLQSVPSQDIPVLTYLSDGSVEAVAIK